MVFFHEKGFNYEMIVLTIQIVTCLHVFLIHMQYQKCRWRYLQAGAGVRASANAPPDKIAGINVHGIAGICIMQQHNVY
jgi:hypothetical protein